MIRRRLLAALFVLLPLGCTTAADQHSYLPPTGAAGTSGHMPSGMVVVTITSPTDGTILPVDSDIDVTATVDVQGGTDYIDTGSVTVRLSPSGGGATSANGVLLSQGGDTYSGKVSLGNLPAGMYDLTVAGRSSGGMQASNHVTIEVDAGPVITIISPKQGNSYNGSLAIELTVDPGAYPLKDGPNATIGGLPVKLTPPDASIPSYRAVVAFGPTTPPPAGVQALPALSGQQLFDVQVTNSNNVKAEARVVFLIDTSGPTITSTLPKSGDVVGGVVHISATVLDPSGVLDSSVVAVISDQETPILEMQLMNEGSGIYGVVFDTNTLTRCSEPPPVGEPTGLCLVFPTISFRAVDLVGNQTVVTYGFGIDNVAPIADLDPPVLRQMALTATGYRCSFLFDPLSLNETQGDMPDDLCAVPQVFDLKARIEDDGNRASEVKVTPISLVDPNNTNVFIMPMAGATQPLTVDSNGDGTCDEINPLLLPASPTTPPAVPSGILEVRLAPIPQQGNANFNIVTDMPVPKSATSLPQDWSPLPCAPGDATAPPKRLCNSPKIPTIAISYSDNEPSIWSVEPFDTTFHCLGNQLDTKANNIPEGWACIAVQTRDKVGNQSVSVPIRVYIQYGGDPYDRWCAPLPANAPPPPNCTGTYDPATKATAFQACGARKFDRTTMEYYCIPGSC